MKFLLKNWTHLSYIDILSTNLQIKRNKINFHITLKANKLQTYKTYNSHPQIYCKNHFYHKILFLILKLWQNLSKFFLVFLEISKIHRVSKNLFDIQAVSHWNLHLFPTNPPSTQSTLVSIARNFLFWFIRYICYKRTQSTLWMQSVLMVMAFPWGF